MRHRVTLVGAVGLALVIGTVSAVVAVRRSPTDLQAGVVPTDEMVGLSHAVYDVDPTDDRALADFATDIFVGRIVGQTGAIGAPTSVPGQDLPQTQFSVLVLQVIKGSATGTVTLNQVGGVDRNVLVSRSDGRRDRVARLMLFEGDRLLRAGQTELFVTYHVPELGWYTLVAGGYSHQAAGNPRERNAVVDRFTRAIEEPVQT